MIKKNTQPSRYSFIVYRSQIFQRIECTELTFKVLIHAFEKNQLEYNIFTCITSVALGV